MILCRNGRSLPMEYFEQMLLKCCAHVWFDNSYKEMNPMEICLMVSLQISSGY